MFQLLTRAQNDLQERYISNIYSVEYHVWNNGISPDILNFDW